jgi:hypothetical protein
MSLRCEQYRALHTTREFLTELMCSPRMSQKELKEKARRCARHFPPLMENGEPMFSNDNFPCPNLEKRKFF